MEEIAPVLGYNRVEGTQQAMPTRRVAEVKLLKKAQEISDAKRGGARDGAGRLTKEELYAKPIRRAEKKIVDNLPNIIDALLDLATGAYVEEMREDGTIRRYQARPDREACRYLIDRIAGKPTERKEINKTGDAPKQIQIFLPDNGRGRIAPGEAIDAEFSEGPAQKPRRALPAG